MTATELIEAGYRLENAKITSVDFFMEDHGVITLQMVLEGGGFGVVFGGVDLGYGYLGAKAFSGSSKAMPYIMRIMDVVGVSRFNAMKGQYVRIAHKGLGSPVKIIGNIIEDKWFDPDSLFNE